MSRRSNRFLLVLTVVLALSPILISLPESAYYPAQTAAAQGAIGNSTSPTMTVSPSIGAPGSSFEVTFSGVEFSLCVAAVGMGCPMGYEIVWIDTFGITRILMEDIMAVDSYQVGDRSYYGFSHQVTVPESARFGMHTVQIRQEFDYSPPTTAVIAEQQFQVISSGDPSIDISPDTGPAGTTLTVTGANFCYGAVPPCDRLGWVSVYWLLPDGTDQKAMGDININRDGTFSVSLQVPGYFTKGTYNLEFNQGNGPTIVKSFVIPFDYGCMGAYKECNGVARPGLRPASEYRDIEDVVELITNVSLCAYFIVAPGADPTTAMMMANLQAVRLFLDANKTDGEFWSMVGVVIEHAPGFSCLKALRDIGELGEKAASCFGNEACRKGVLEKLQDYVDTIGEVWEQVDSGMSLASTVDTGQLASISDGYATWIWGPAANTGMLYESYFGAVTDTSHSPLDHWRTVIYFDKSRMEINRSDGDRSSPWYVTNGLLARELITGEMQVGDNAWYSFVPATVNVAGDSDDQTGPTYQTMNMVKDRLPHPEGTAITQRISRNGQVQNDSSLNAYNVMPEVLSSETSHRTAAPFWEFMSVTASVYGSPYYVTGLPITEAYWANVKVSGTYKDVLMQCFERRCLTFTPDNTPEWRVEMGNIGQHYYTWRYEEIQSGEQPPAAPPPPSTPMPPGNSVVAEGLAAPLHASVGGDGAIYVAEGGIPTENDECVVIGEDPETGEEFTACFGLNGSVTVVNDDGSARVITGLPGISDIHVTVEGDMYAVTSLGGTPEMRDLFEDENAQAMGTLIQIHGDGDWTVIADLAKFEADQNPEPSVVDSNPYALTMDGDNFLVVDAGGNTLLRVTPSGEISTLTVFSSRMVEAPPFLGLPDGTEIPMESVPTDVEVGPDGNYYVSELTGFPFTVGSARVWRVTSGGSAEVHATGFSAIGALDFDREGNLHILEIATKGLLAAEMNPEDPNAALSRLVKLAPNGTRSTVVGEGISFATGLAINTDNQIFIVNFSVMPTAQVIRVN